MQRKPDRSSIRRLLFRAIPAAVLAVAVASPAAAAAASGQAQARPAPDPQLHRTDTRGRQPKAEDVRNLSDKAASSPSGTVRVIVDLDADFQPEGLLDDASARGQRAKIGGSRSRVVDATKQAGGKVIHQYDSIPSLALELSPSAVAELAAREDVASIVEDGVLAPDLDVSRGRVGAADVQDRGYTGSGWTVAVLDTGIDRTHPFLSGFVDEACFSSGNGCPNGTSVQGGTGAAAACTYDAAGCQHGTHVSGIAIGREFAGSTAPPGTVGIAPGAALMPVQVFHQGNCAPAGAPAQPCPRTFDSDILAGLNYVYGRRTMRNIAAVNLSLGSDAAYAYSCDSRLTAYKTVIDNLRSAGIATVISSGNAASKTGVSEPACVTSAVAVGSVDDSDSVPASSNSGPLLDLLAPGVNIMSSVPGGGFANKSGTSMAAPHVAGAFALFRQKNSSATVDQIESLMKSTGVPVTDTHINASNRVTPRLRIDRAMALADVDLTDQGARGYRNPTPLSHGFKTLQDKRSWSVVAVKPDTTLDVDLDLYDAYTMTGQLARSTSGMGQTDLVAVDGNRRADDWTFPQVRQAYGSGRYKVRYSNPGATLPGATTDLMFGNDTLVTVFDTPQVAGTRYGYRVVPLQGEDPEIIVVTSDPANAGTWVRGRQTATQVASSGGAGRAESVDMIAPVSGDAGLIITQRSGCCTYKLYADSSAPSGVISINNGMDTTASQQVTVALAGTDSESGLAEPGTFDGSQGGGGMRISVDGTLDTESWEPYSGGGRTVTLPAGAGTKVVSVQLRNNAGLTTTVSDSIVLLGNPDLAVGNLSSPPVSGTVGGSFVIGEQTWNKANGPAGASTTRFYLSTDTVQGAGDQVMTGAHAVPSLSSMQIHYANTTVTVPATTPAGTYYVLACADADRVVPETDEANCLPTSGRITVAAPDLAVSAVSNPPAFAARGSAFSATETTVNRGGVTSPQTATVWYLSTDTVAGGDIQVGALWVPALAPGASHAVMMNITVPTATQVGYYWLIACADGYANAGETSEANNCTATATQVRIT
jgi:subtilisin